MRVPLSAADAPGDAGVSAAAAMPAPAPIRQLMVKRLRNMRFITTPGRIFVSRQPTPAPPERKLALIERWLNTISTPVEDQAGRDDRVAAVAPTRQKRAGGPGRRKIRRPDWRAMHSRPG